MKELRKENQWLLVDEIRINRQRKEARQGESMSTAPPKRRKEDF